MLAEDKMHCCEEDVDDSCGIEDSNATSTIASTEDSLCVTC